MGLLDSRNIKEAVLIRIVLIKSIKAPYASVCLRRTLGCLLPRHRPAGRRPMMDDGVLEEYEPDVIFAQHVRSGLPAGQMSVR